MGVKYFLPVPSPSFLRVLSRTSLQSSPSLFCSTTRKATPLYESQEFLKLQDGTTVIKVIGPFCVENRIHANSLPRGKTLQVELYHPLPPVNSRVGSPKSQHLRMGP